MKNKYRPNPAATGEKHFGHRSATLVNNKRSASSGGVLRGVSANISLVSAFIALDRKFMSRRRLLSNAVWPGLLATK